MKLNNFFTRARTALLFVAVMVGGIWWNVYSYAVLMTLIIFFCLYEYYNMLKYTREKNRVSFIYPYLTIVSSLALFVASLFIVYGKLDFYYYSFFLVVIFGFFGIELFADSSKPMSNISQNITAIIYIPIPFVILNHMVIQQDVYQPKFLLGIIFLIWINDAAAYVAGSLFGKHKFFERISPNKTIEGLLGGILGCFIVAWLIFMIFGVFRLVDWFVIALLVAIFATMGDLIVSMFKRSLKIKDTGEFFPGHGGFLDRFDAFLFCIPFVAIYVFYIT